MAVGSEILAGSSLTEVERMDQAICIYSAKGNLLFFNQQFLDFLELPETVAHIGARRTDIVGFIAARGDFGAGDPRQLATERIQRMDRGATYRYQRRVPNGRTLDIRQQITPDGLIIATYTDITAARRLEAAVATIAEAVSHSAGHGYLQTLANAMSRALGLEWVIIGVLDEVEPDTITTVASSRNGVSSDGMSYHLHGSPCAGVIGQAICVIPHKARELFPDDKALVERGVESYVGAPLFDADGKSLGILAAFDTRPLADDPIAEPVLEIFASRVAAELDRLKTFEVLRKSERRFRNFAEIGSDWLWEMDADLRFSWIADNIETLTGQTPDYFVGKSREDLRAPEDDSDNWAGHMATLRAHEPFRDFQYRRELPDGRTMWVSNSGIPQFGADGSFQGYFGASSNITERKQAELEIQKAKEEAEDANRAKSRFLAGVSHELRTPLNAIIGFSEIIGTEMFGAIDNPAYVQYGKDIHGSGQLLLGLISDILDLSQIDAEELSLKEAPEDTFGLVNECVHLFEKRAAEAKIDVSVDLTDAPRSLCVDGRRIKQILVNLLGNAIKFTPAGGWIKVRGGLKQGGGLVLEVEDNGIGMAAKDIERALQPFSQLESSIMRGQEGVGLGLAISSRLAALHGGRLQLSGEPGVGTRVQIHLPASRVINQDNPSAACSV